MVVDEDEGKDVKEVGERNEDGEKEKEEKEKGEKKISSSSPTLSNYPDLYDCFRWFLSPERLEDENSYFCEKCGV